MALSISWGTCGKANGNHTSAITIDTKSIKIDSNGMASISGIAYKEKGSREPAQNNIVGEITIINKKTSIGKTFTSPKINVSKDWNLSDAHHYKFEFTISGLDWNTGYESEFETFWIDKDGKKKSITVGWGGPNFNTGSKPLTKGNLIVSDMFTVRDIKFGLRVDKTPSDSLTYVFERDRDSMPEIESLTVSRTSATSQSYSKSVPIPASAYGKQIKYSIEAQYNDTNHTLYCGQIFTKTIPYPTGRTGVGFSYNKEDDKVFVYAYTYSELYDRTGKIIWNGETLFDDTVNKSSNINETVELIKDYYPAPSEDGTYYGSIEITNPDDTTYGSMTNSITLSSALSNDDSFKIEISAINKLKVIFETGRKLTESKTATITATYSNKNQDYSTYSSFKKQDTIDLASGSYHFEPTLELGEDAPNGIYLITVSTGSTDTISKEITIIKKKEETDLTCTVEESARNPHRFYLTFENFVPGVKYDRTVKISLTKKSTATKIVDNQILLTKSTNTVTIPASDVARTTIANSYIAWDKSKNIYDDVLTATINVYGTIDGKEVLLRSFTDLKTIYPAWSPIQEFSWPEGQEVAVGKKFNITAETWNNLQLKVISSIENIIDDLDSSSIIDVQSGQIFTKDIYNNLISFLNLAEVKSYISATTDLPTAESITKYLNENHLFVYNTPMDLPVYDISKYGKALPQTVVITAKKLNDIVDRVNAIIRKLNSTSTTS